MAQEQIHFVTGRLAEYALRGVLDKLAPRAGFQYTVDVLPITVAALMTPHWIKRHWQVPPQASRVLLPGYCEGDLNELQAELEIPVQLGPRDLRGLPEFFGQEESGGEEYGTYDIEILAEINNAPQWQLTDLLAEASRLASDGADIIDVGCDPGGTWSSVGECVRALRDAGHRVSIDSLNPKEIEAAVAAGAELVLSVNSSNRDQAADWGCQVVVIPDEPRSGAGLSETIDQLAQAGCSPADRSHLGTDRLRFRGQPGTLPGCSTTVSRRRDDDGNWKLDGANGRRLRRRECDLAWDLSRARNSQRVNDSSDQLGS